MKKNRKTTGFTLIEILVVIGIIAILAAIVIIAINPAKQFAQARNTQRQAGVNTILNAVGQRIADNKGIFQGSFNVGGNVYFCAPLPPTVGGTATAHINVTPLTATTTTVSGDLGCLVPTYVATLPLDPDTTYAIDPYTGYDIGVDPTGRVTVCASKGAESSIPGSGPICVTR
jgi:type IV pilus assembly protein PilA